MLTFGNKPVVRGISLEMIFSPENAGIANVPGLSIIPWHRM